MWLLLLAHALAQTCSRDCPNDQKDAFGCCPEEKEAPRASSTKRAANLGNWGYAPAEAGCRTGLVEESGVCCWSGQGALNGRCVGTPKACPSGLSVQGETCGCGAGRSLTSGHCCWPGQAWSDSAGACVGNPTCSSGFVADGKGGCESSAAVKARKDAEAAKRAEEARVSAARAEEEAREAAARAEEEAREAAARAAEDARRASLGLKPGQVDVETSGGTLVLDPPVRLVGGVFYDERNQQLSKAWMESLVATTPEGQLWVSERRRAMAMPLVDRPKRCPESTRFADPELGSFFPLFAVGAVSGLVSVTSGVILIDSPDNQAGQTMAAVGMPVFGLAVATTLTDWQVRVAKDKRCDAHDAGLSLQTKHSDAELLLRANGTLDQRGY